MIRNPVKESFNPEGDMTLRLRTSVLEATCTPAILSQCLQTTGILHDPIASCQDPFKSCEVSDETPHFSDSCIWKTKPFSREQNDWRQGFEENEEVQK